MMGLSQCYNNDGSPSSDVPCDPNALVSACCKNRSFCATNLFCVDPSKGRIAGTCTERGWGKNALNSCPCPGFIQNTPFDPVTNVTDCVNGIYCCNGNNEGCCALGQGHLSVVYDANMATAFLGMSPISTLTAAADPKPSPPFTTGLSKTTLQNSTFEGLPIHSTTVLASVNGSTDATASATTTAASGGNDGGFSQMGIGVALGLGTPLLLILGACIFLFVRLRETRVQVKEVEGPMLRVKRSINTLREKRSMATLNEGDERWI